MKKYGYSDERWFTGGNFNDYASLLSIVDQLENVPTDDIVEIASDIYEHCDFSDYMNCGCSLR